MAQQYIGVYATKERAHSLGEFPRPSGMRKRIWFVWEMPDGKYTVQALNAAHQPMAAARIITGKEFSSRFTYEADCLLAPEGYTHPAAQTPEAPPAPLPDPGEKGGRTLPASALASLSAQLTDGPDMLLGPVRHRAGDGGAPQAADPDLLLNWAKAERRPKAKAPDPVKIPFARLMSEVVSSEDAAAAPERAPGDVPESGEDEAHQVRQLRSRFVQALLLLRRGARAEGLALLETMLDEPCESFTGGVQLFSEFGLGLRRLGFAPLALAAHKRALEFAPDDARILFNIARSYHDQGLIMEAKDFLEQSLAVAPDFAPARQFLAFLAFSDGNTEK